MLILVTAAAALWLATRPYQGIANDAQLYTLQALNALQHGHFDHDLYLRFGSQDQFTLFSAVYEPFLAAFGLSTGVLLATIAGQAVWLTGFILLLRTFTRSNWETAAVAAGVIALPSYYNIIGFGESVVTPRQFAEGLSMAGLALLLRGHRVGSLATLVVAALLHPLMTVPALAAWFCYQFRLRWTWICAALTPPAALAGLCAAGVEPFARVGETFDPTWFEIVQTRDSWCLVLGWSWLNIAVVSAAVATAAFMLTLTAGRDRAILGTTLVVGLGGLATTFVGGDLLHNVLVVDAQTWRAIWLLAVVANAFAVRHLVRTLTQHPIRPPELLLLSGLGILLLGRVASIVYFPADAALLAGFVINLPGLRWGATAAGGRAATVISVTMAGACGAGVVLQLIHGMRPDEVGPLLVAFAPVAAALLPVWAVITVPQPVTPDDRRRVGAAALLAAAILLVAAARWDQRDAWTRLVESPAAARDAAGLIPPQATVYWDGGVRMLWFGLDRPSYFSCEQGTGALFSRDTAMAYARRRDSIMPLRELEYEGCPSLEYQTPPQPTTADLKRACLQEPALDYVVLGRHLPGLPSRDWPSPAQMAGGGLVDSANPINRVKRFYIYACADARDAPP
jgi:hypothetical protein